VNEPRPVEVEVTNRGEGAATGPGLVIGSIGVLVVLMVASTAFVALLFVAIPLAILAFGVWLARLIHRMDARSQDWVREMGFDDLPRQFRQG
jgi:hypothetical protein